MTDDLSRFFTPGTKYRPSNGTEGDGFIGDWCGRCKRDAAFRNDEGDSCPIVAATLALDVDDPEYPVEWVYDERGQPKCTAFEAEGGAYRCAETPDMFPDDDSERGLR
jgi:hypothetical protein